MSNSAEIGDRRGERTAHLRTSGFESCTVRAPNWDVRGSLDWYFQHPARYSLRAYRHIAAVSALRASARSLAG